MVNSVEATAIPLAGRGFVHRPSGGYAPGEFKRLVNMEITDNEILQKRPPVEIGSNIHTGFNENSNFIGHLEEWTVIQPFSNFIANTNDVHYFAKRDGIGQNTNTIWNALNLYTSGFHAASEGHAIVGFFRYNGRNYWISVSYESPGTVRTYKYYLHNYAPGTTYDVAVSPLIFATTLPTVHTFLFQVSVDTLGMFGVQSFQHIKFFWFKDRLWILTNRGIYFSKATDPTDFSAPEGGFFLFPDDLSKNAVAHHDRIYVLGNDNLSCITYTTDPNTDAEVISVAKGVGGDALVLHEDSVYMIRVDQLFLVEPNRVTKVLDLNLGYRSGNDVQLTSWFDHLIVCVRTSVDTLNSDGITHSKFPVFSKAGYSTANAYDIPANVDWYTNNFFINMKNGSVYEFMYQDHVKLNTWGDPDTVRSPVAWFFNPFEHPESDEYFLWFLCTKVDEGTVVDDYPRVFTLRYGTKLANDIFNLNKGYDFIWTETEVGSSAATPCLVEIDSFTPDGAEMWVKKFRTLAIEGEFHNHDGDKDFPPTPDYTGIDQQYGVRLAFAYDNQPYGNEILISKALDETSVDPDVTSNMRLPYAVRVPLNQRARSVSVRFIDRSDPDIGPLLHAYRFALHKLMMLWMPTNRSIASRTGE